MHRDDDEASRAHIEALERELADARRERDEARAHAEHAKQEAGRTKRHPDAESKAESKGKKPRNRKAQSPHASPEGAPGWQRQRFLRAIMAAAALGYSAMASVLVLSFSDRAMMVAFLGGSVWMVVATALIAWRTGAPGIFNGAISTLLWSAGSMGAVFVASTPYLAESMGLEGALSWGLRGVLALAAVSIGSIATAHFTTDAASSDSTGPD